MQVPHAVAALLQLQMAAVLLQLVIDGFGPVRIGSIDDLERVAVQLFGSQHWCIVAEQLLRGFHIVGVQPGPGQFVHGPFHNLHLLRGEGTVSLHSGQLRQQRF